MANQSTGMTVRQAAIVAGFAYLLNPVSYAEYSIYPKLVIPGNIEQTAANISAHGPLFVGAIFCYLISFTGDVVIAWALYFLLAPVNRSLSLLMAWFQLVYAAIAFYATLHLVAAYRLLSTPDYLAVFGAAPLHAQVLLLLRSFRYDWSMSLVLFGIHLVLLGYLIYRSRYIPRLLGILLVINGFGWMIDSLGPYVFPHADFGFTFVTFFGELLFMLWLLIRGWKIQEPAPNS
ncbi:MAG: DUF4386 domain-containing protein [Steroidobacteraceae bacterium]